MKKHIKDKCKKMFSIMKNAWITVWLITVAILLCITSTYAAYTGVTQSKRVISLSDRDDMLFSSRYMFVNGSDVQKIGFAENTEDPTITIDVCNYDKSGLGKYGSDIYFKISARLINYDGTETNNITSDKFNIAFVDNDNESTVYKISSLSNKYQFITGPETYDSETGLFKLEGGTKNKLKFVLHFDSSALSSPVYAVEVMAQPIGKYDDIKKISGKVAAVSRNNRPLAKLN